MKSNASPKSASKAREPKAHAKGPAGGKEAAAGGKPPGDAKDAPAADPKSSRVALLKARHEAIRREIDQIREDLENEEEE